MSATNRIQVVPGGPLLCRGRFRVLSADGSLLLEDAKVALCRCGHSARKPFCDGAHKAAGFADPGHVVAPVGASGGASAAEGVVDVVAAANGPLLVSGSYDVEGASGSMSFRGGRGALCRCGASQNKPLCDGSHKHV